MKWKIFKYSDKYEVNILGQIRNVRTGRYTQPVPDKDGYFRVVVYFNGKTNNYIVHRIIAEHFIPNPNNYPIINHKDGNKQNNKISNLEWCTNLQNMQHAARNGFFHGRKGEEHHNARLAENDIREIRKLRKQGVLRNDVAKRFSIQPQQVTRICSYQRWGHVK